MKPSIMAKACRSVGPLAILAGLMTISSAQAQDITGSTDQERGRSVVAILLPEMAASGGVLTRPEVAPFAFDLGDLAVQNAFGSLWARPDLSLRERSLVSMGTLLALRTEDELHFHFRIARRLGISVAEIEEVIYMAAGYAGFPAASTGMKVGRQIFDAKPDADAQATHSVTFHDDALTRQGREAAAAASAKDAEVVVGDGAGLMALLTPVPVETGLLAPRKGEGFASDLSDLAASNLFGRLWTRPGLNLHDRSLVALGMLIALRSETDLESHFQIALEQGITPAQLEEVIYQTTAYAGFEAASRAAEIGRRVIVAQDGSGN